MLEGSRLTSHRYAAAISLAAGVAAVSAVIAVRLSGADVRVTVTDALAVGFVAVVIAETTRFWIRRLSTPTETGTAVGVNDAGELDAFAAFHSIRVRVRGALDGRDVFARLLSPLLAEIADDLLLRRHGIVRSVRPDRARELLGDELSAATTEPTSLDVLDIELLERLLDRLDEL